ncbi:MAG: flippase-like domain-containing protein [Anaerolineales bacterium]|nr:flippase-like domain-containing protein [Anaerolineales bacterium]
MKKIFIFIIFFLGVVVVVTSFGELETILQTLKQAKLIFFLLAIFFQMIWFLTSGWMYQSIFHLLGVRDDVLSLSRIAAAAAFVNVVAPTGGAGGVALFAAEAKRRGHPAGKATVAAALFLLSDMTAFLIVLALGIIVLIRRNNLDAGEISASIFLFVAALGFAFMLYVGYRSAERLGNLLAKLARGINRVSRFFRKKNLLEEERAYHFAQEIAEGFGGLTEKSSHLIRPILWGVLDKILLMAILLCSFLAFDVPFSAGTIVAGFSIAYLFLIVSPTPSGIGIVEGIMPVALNSLAVNWSQGVVVTLMYRAVTFWIPLGVGAWAFRSLHQERDEEAKEEGA